MPVSFAESGGTGTPDSRQHGGLRVRKGVAAPVPRGKGRAFEWEQHEQDSRALGSQGCLEKRK